MSSENGPKSGLNLLILDDSEEFASLISSIFKKENITIETYSCPQEALKVLEKNYFDVVLTDYLMGDMDGLYFSELALRKSKNKKIPIVLLTAKDLEEDELEVVKKLGLTYLKKPCTPPKLLETIKKTAKS